MSVDAALLALVVQVTADHARRGCNSGTHLRIPGECYDEDPNAGAPWAASATGAPTGNPDPTTTLSTIKYLERR